MTAERSHRLVVKARDFHDRLRSQHPIETGKKWEINDSSSPSELESRGYARGDDSGLWTQTQSAPTTELVAGSHISDSNCEAGHLSEAELSVGRNKISPADRL
jgi:hypothetical protein